MSSPSDVEPERERLARIIDRLNGEFREVVRLHLVRWEERLYAADCGFQDQIQAAAECDLVLCILWSRIGTPLPSDRYRRGDGTAYESGTVYEVETALAARKERGAPDVYVFRKAAEVRFSSEESRLELERGAVPDARGRLAPLVPRPGRRAEGSLEPVRYDRRV